MYSKIVLVAVLMTITVTFGTHHEEHHAPAHYKFEYGVSYSHTGDKKSQHEHRDGHVVKGEYTLKEADGTMRIVKYESGPHSGFNAVVKRVGHAQHSAHYGHHTHNGKGGHSGKGGTSYVGTIHFGYKQ